tara:strand:+ start:1738 stop:2871 length:1134 start_codon:yes stop_codon:yes gene_type:complete
MAIYFLLFFVVAILAISNMRSSEVTLPKNFSLSLSPSLFLFFICLVIFIGLRHETGGDWGNYIYQLQKASLMKLDQLITFGGDPFYQAIKAYAASFTCEYNNSTCAFNEGGLQFLNTVCAIFFCYGLIVFCKHQPRPWLALCVAVPYLIIVVGIGYTRQAAALGFIMLALTAMSHGRIFQYCIWILVGATIHKTALIMLPFMIFGVKKNKTLILIAGTIFALLLYYFFLIEFIAILAQNYLESEYDAAGALIRLMMTAIPATIFLFFRNSFTLNNTEKDFWTGVSVFALLLVFLYFISPSSTAVDRLGLYLIPLQLFVFSRLPDVFGSYGARNPIINYLIIIYSLLVLITWMFFSFNAKSWIPYKSFIWVWLGITHA